MFFDEGYHGLHVGIVAVGVYLKFAAFFVIVEYQVEYLANVVVLHVCLAVECFEHQVDSFVVVVFFHNCRCFLSE